MVYTLPCYYSLAMYLTKSSVEEREYTIALGVHRLYFGWIICWIHFISLVELGVGTCLITLPESIL